MARVDRKSDDFQGGMPLFKAGKYSSVVVYQSVPIGARIATITYDTKYYTNCFCQAGRKSITNFYKSMCYRHPK